MGDLLDLAVARGVTRWRLAERALHDHGRWTFRYHGVEVDAFQFRRKDRISFVGHFPPMCLTGAPELIVELLLDGEVQRVIDLDEPLDEDGAEFWFDIMIDTPIQVS